MGSLSNGDLCDRSSNKRPLENGYCTSFDAFLKFKKRKVSAVRSFPSGCGRNALRGNLMAQDTEAVVSLGDKENSIPDKKTVNIVIRDCVKTSESGNGSLSHQLVNNAPENSKGLREVEAQAVVETEGAPESKIVLEIGSMVDGVEIIPASGSKAWYPPQWPLSDANISKGTALKNKYPRRRVSATRDFPPFCGRNAPWPTEEERMVFVLGNRTPMGAKEEGRSVRETARTVGKEFDGHVQDGIAKRRKLKRSVPEPENLIQKAAVRNESLKETVMAEEEGVALRDIARAGAGLDGDVGGANSQKRKLEGSLPEAKTKSVSRVNAYGADHLCRKSMKKKLLPSTKTSYDRKGAQVFKEGGEFSVKQRNGGSPAGQRVRDVEVILPRFGPNSSSHGNMRSKVRETLRLFHAICRKLLQRYMNWRIDLEADRIIRARGKTVNTGKQVIGSVPGVEVGDQFLYRVELALVGIHRPYQAGIDYIKHGGAIIATSIVASGSYADDLDNPDVLIYSGHGGNVVGRVKIPEDQKLEKGNLALKNSMTTRNPVRVIHGIKERKTSTLDAKAKMVLTYTYDGLYTVDRYWNEIGPHGKLVFRFELKRIPGQPEVAWKVVKNSNKFKTREGLCVRDISGGKELFPICAVNTKGIEKPPKFNYVTKMKYPDCYCPTSPRGCDCIGGCSDAQKCSCLVKNGGEFPYTQDGAIVEVKTLVYECGPACKCPPSCYNRVSQHGIKIQLEVFKTQQRGWGVRSLNSIPSGSFICEYVGELLDDKDAEKRQNDEYLFDIGQNYRDCSVTGKSDTQLNPIEVVGDSCFTIDAARCANVGRFINHSCFPNLYAQNVLYDHEDKRMPHIMLFAAENIPPLQELTYDYNYKVDQIQDSNGQIKMKRCYCGSAGCTGRMY